MKKILLSLLTLVVLSTACIQELEVFDGSSEILVVNGEITNGNEEVRVSLSYTTTYNKPINYNDLKKAQVTIVDDLDNRFPLEYTEYGKFIGSNFNGQIGRSYHVEVILSNGDEYYSIPEEMLPVPQVEAIDYQLTGNGVQFNASFEDPAGQENFYRWRYTGTFENFSEVAYQLRDDEEIQLSNRCYAWTVQPDFEEVYNCWATDYDEEFLLVESDFAYNGRYQPSKELFTIELDNKFNYGYSMLVSQYSLTESAFIYWEAISGQIGNGGSIFETANYQIVGNLRSRSNPSEVVLGYFTVSAVESNRIFIDQWIRTFDPVVCEQSPNTGCYPKRCVDCRSYPGNSRNVAPDFWPEEYLNDLP